MNKLKLILAAAILGASATNRTWAANLPSVQWSLSGGTVAVISGSVVQVFDSSGNRLQTQQLEAAPTAITLSPDGTKVAYILGGRQAWILDLSSGMKTQIFSSSDSTQSCGDPRWGPTGQSLTYTVMAVVTGANGASAQGSIFMIRPDGSGKVLLYTFSL